MDEIKFAERLTAVEQSTKSAHHRLDNIEKLTESVYALANETKTMREDMNKLQTDVDSIKAVPQKRYETVINTLITTIVGAVVGYLIAKYSL